MSSLKWDFCITTEKTEEFPGRRDDNSLLQPAHVVQPHTLGMCRDTSDIACACTSTCHRWNDCHFGILSAIFAGWEQKMALQVLRKWEITRVLILNIHCVRILLQQRNYMSKLVVLSWKKISRYTHTWITHWTLCVHCAVRIEELTNAVYWRKLTDLSLVTEQYPFCIVSIFNTKQLELIDIVLVASNKDTAAVPSNHEIIRFCFCCMTTNNSSIAVHHYNRHIYLNKNLLPHFNAQALKSIINAIINYPPDTENGSPRSHAGTFCHGINRKRVRALIASWQVLKVCEMCCCWCFFSSL